MDILSGSVLKLSHILVEKLLDKENKNIALSPISILLAVKMVLEGAEGDTKTQIEKGLEVQKGESPSAKELKEVLTNLLNKKDYELRLANGLFQEKKFEIKKNYIELLKKRFSANIEAVDFKNNAEAAREKINQWVNTLTNGKIKLLFEQGSLNSSTCMALINVIYFKGFWENKFDKANTTDADFHLTKNEKKKVKMMHKKGKFKYAENAEKKCKVLEIPFKGGISMIIVLPNEIEGVKELHSKIPPEVIVTWMKAGNMQVADIVLSLPIMKIEAQFDVVPILKSLGIFNLFQDNADLSGISDVKGLQLTTVMHKCFLNVDEEGAEAAAATGIGIGVTSVSDQYEFNANRAFIMYMVDRETKLVIFQCIYCGV